MAKKIEQIDKQVPTKAEEDAAALQQLLEQVAEHQTSLSVFLEIVGELHQAGVLDMIKGLLRTRDEVGALAIQQLNQPGAHRIIQNGMSALQTLSRIDPGHLSQVMNGLMQGLEKANDVQGRSESLGLWAMVKTMRDPDVNASLQTMLGFMQGMGKELKNS